MRLEAYGSMEPSLEAIGLGVQTIWSIAWERDLGLSTGAKTSIASITILKQCS